jgi:5-methylcytosine-specific restriction protein A
MVAAQAMARAHFKCEVDPTHQTFISRARRVPYVEAHHLVPMSQQEVFPVSLDVEANVVALCATCHKLLHHGRAADKRDHLIKLLADREERLKAAEILFDKSALFRLYSRDLPDEE